MPHHIDRIALPAVSPGTARHLSVHRFGKTGARPKAYLQASIHADEPPGMLVLHHLLGRLIAANATGAIKGEIVLVPYANPIGLGQWVNRQHLGRFELAGGGNFNRGYINLADMAAGQIAGNLSGDPEENVSTIRAALLASLAELEAETEFGALRLALLRRSIDADIVLDLHCDDDALLHLYCATALWPALADLSAELGSRATLLADSSGGEPFDEAHSLPWIELRARFGTSHPIPMACQSATVELRGRSDVDDETATADADALYRFLTRRGLIEGTAPPLPAPHCEATPLSATDVVKAPTGGVIVYKATLGQRVKAGDVIAEIVDPAADHPSAARTAIKSRADGILFTRLRERLVRPGMPVAKVVGTTPLSHRTGRLLED